MISLLPISKRNSLPSETPNLSGYGIEARVFFCFSAASIV